ARAERYDQKLWIVQPVTPGGVSSCPINHRPRGARREGGGTQSNVEVMCEEPSLAGFLRRVATFSRGLCFDKRGTGVSDPVPLAALSIPNRTRRDGSALLARMEVKPTAEAGPSPEAPEVSPNEPARTPDLLPSRPVGIAIPMLVATLRKPKCERGDLNPHGFYPT